MKFKYSLQPNQDALPNFLISISYFTTSNFFYFVNWNNKEVEEIMLIQSPTSNSSPKANLQAGN
jgi:predicted Fe-Mo cluster-binding NifX family protein